MNRRWECASIDAMGDLNFARLSKSQEPKEASGARTKHQSKAQLWHPKAMARDLKIPCGGQHFHIA